MAVTVLEAVLQAADLVEIRFSADMKNDDQLQDTSNYTIAVTGGSPSIDRILSGSSISTRVVYLQVRGVVDGGTHTVTVDETGLIVSTSNESVADAGNSAQFIGRQTKMDTLNRRHPKLYDKRVGGRLRSLFGALMEQDELIGGSRSDTITPNPIVCDPVVVGACWYELIETQTVSSVGSFDFTTVLNGNSEEGFQIRYAFQASGFAAGEDIRIRVNGMEITTNALTNANTFSPAFAHQPLSNEFALYGTPVSAQARGYVDIPTLRSPGGVDLHLTALTHGTVADPTPTTGNSPGKTGQALWTDETTNITSLGVAFAAAGTFSGIFELWRLVT